jgi:citrate lyase subunit beta/citryl-CoA lyase
MNRSLFFAPANRHDLIAKFPRFRADYYVIDLEDGTPPSEKASARTQLKSAIDALREKRVEGRVLVRVNEPSSEHYIRDIQAAVACDIDGLVIAKLENQDQLFPACHSIEHARRADDAKRRVTIMGGIESMRGVINVAALVSAHPLVDAVYFGAEDFASDIGGRRTPQGLEVLYARSQVVLAARAAGVVALDQAVADIRDDELYRRDAETGRDLGYQGKICLLPRQVEICNQVFSPSAAEVEAAHRLISAYAAATATGIGTIEFEGKMIDGPLLKRAEAIVAMARG